MKFFTITELSRSATATKYHITNKPGNREIANMKALIENLLDPIRQEWGHAIYVSSGYRGPELNAKVGGSRTSHHLRGMAADISAGSQEQNRLLFDLIVDMCKDGNISFTQLIDESKEQTAPYRWLHISYDPDNLRCETKHGGYKDPATGLTVYHDEEILR